MKKTFSVLNAVLIAAVLAGCGIYYAYGGLLLKGITCFGFVIVGAVNLCYAMNAKLKDKRFPVLMALGLLVCWIGDVVLNIRFICGALIFAAGHLIYVTAYCCLKKFTAKDLIPIGIIALGAILLVTVSPWFRFDSVQIELVCVFYAVVISFMSGKAISNLLAARNSTHWVIAAGCVLFFISDLTLALNVFAGAPRIFDTICLVTYYPAQCLLAHSIYRCTAAQE